jgi:uncharacterized ferritin-like protein (DUF455 family)
MWARHIAKVICRSDSVVVVDVVVACFDDCLSCRARNHWVELMAQCSWGPPHCRSIALASRGACVVRECDLTRKIQLSRDVIEEFRRALAVSPWPQPLPGTEQADAGNAHLPTNPGRPAAPLLVEPRDYPSTCGRAGVSMSIYTLHALAHIELTAVDVYWDTICRHYPYLNMPTLSAGTLHDLTAVMPAEFFVDFMAVLSDEVTCFRMAGYPIPTRVSDDVLCLCACALVRLCACVLVCLCACVLVCLCARVRVCKHERALHILFGVCCQTRHFEAVRARLRELGADYGVIPAHRNLWQLCQNSRDSLAGRLAAIPLVQEARGLDCMS